ncbi:MAG: peptide deformylase [Candidatus Taylorbacteria bacterium]|nr:peptide deformylase [Candidatus Taylorbacteria bacterium]
MKKNDPKVPHNDNLTAKDVRVLESARLKWSHIENGDTKEAQMIVSEGNATLRTEAKEVPIEEISSPKIQKVISDMKRALQSQSDGVGLAAPQIGVPLRIFIVSKRVYDDAPDDMVFINPKIVKFSKEKRWMEGEGCLSVRWVYGKVERSTKVTLRAYDEQGNLFERGAGGLLAHIFQHEVDHLDGILFIDKAKDLEEADPEAIKKEHKHK